MATVVSIVDSKAAKMVYLCVVEVLSLSHTKHFSSIGSSEKFALAVKQLQGIPLTGVVRCGDDDTTISTCHTNGQLCGWSCGIANIYDIVAHTHKGSYDNIANHQTRHTTIAAYYHLTSTNELSIGCCKLNDIEWVESIASGTANGTTDTGNGFNQCHME